MISIHHHSTVSVIVRWIAWIDKTNSDFSNLSSDITVVSIWDIKLIQQYGYCKPKMCAKQNTKLEMITKHFSSFWPQQFMVLVCNSIKNIFIYMIILFIWYWTIFRTPASIYRNRTLTYSEFCVLDLAKVTEPALRYGLMGLGSSALKPQSLVLLNDSPSSICQSRGATWQPP